MKLNPIIIALAFATTSTTLTGCTSLMYAAYDGPIQTDPYKRTFGQYLEDSHLERIIRVNLRKASSELNQDSHINIQVYNNVVLLTGETPSSKARNLAGEVVKKIYQVRQVHNELQVGPNSAFSSRVNDNWLEGKVKSKIIKDKTVDEDYVRVIVEAETVFLMGMVSQQQADRATELARRTSGVKKVVKVFEYIKH